jgi:DNA-binding SARP family transcriptional activator
MPKLAIYLFGAPRIEYLGEEIGLDTRKATALLAYLVLTESRHTRDAISHLLWPDYDHGRGRANLRRTLSVIRKATGGYGLLFERDSVSLDMTADIWADVWQFQRLIRECDQHDHASDAFCSECESILLEAVDLYNYEFMTGFTLRDSAEFDDWQYLQSDALRRVLNGALQKLVRCHENKRSYETAIGHARRLLNLDPLHEPAHRGLMTLYELNGQRSAALRQYRQCVRVLEEELGVQPLEATTELYERILSGEFIDGERSATEGVEVHGTHESKSVSFTSIPEPYPDRHSTATLPLVARQEEWSKILQVFESITEDGRVIVLEGEAGIGKTRLAESFIVYARQRGVTVVTARCYEGEANLAYGPLVEGLSKIARGCQDTGWWRSMSPLWLADAGRLLPELLDLRNDPQPLTPLDDPGAQTRFFEAISQVLTVVCSRNDVDPLLPTILFIDDLHWADEATIEYLSYLVRRLNDRRICVLVTLRKPENSAGSRLRQLIAERQRAGEATLITLGRLDRAAVKELIVASGFIGTDSNKASEELAQQLYRETEGLPFFVVEYLNVFDQGIMVTDSPRSDTSKAMFHDGDRADLRSMPNSVRDLLRAKLSAVGQPALQLLHTAAVIGRSFDFDLLREVSGRSEEEVVTALEELIDRGLVSEHVSPI